MRYAVVQTTHRWILGLLVLLSGCKSAGPGVASNAKVTQFEQVFAIGDSISLQEDPQHPIGGITDSELDSVGNFYLVDARMNRVSQFSVN